MISRGMLIFVFLYPITMSFVWMIGTLLYHFLRDRRTAGAPEPGPGAPLVSVLVPCHNEESCIEETIAYLSLQTYPNFEVIAIDDASTDRTGEILKSLKSSTPNLRIVTLRQNQGKGTGLTMAALHARGEILVCIDADALLDKDAIRWFCWHFSASPRVGAITGNPKVRNRTTVLGKIQVGEYSTIIGMIKRAQRILGKIYTVSGVVVAFRKKALLEVGFWSNNMVTEDIDVSWKLQLAHWDIRYEPRVLCWILVPETFKGLFRQRLRWAQGGSEVLLKYAKDVFLWKNRRIWLLYFDYLMSVLWCYCVVITWIAVMARTLTPGLGLAALRGLLPDWYGVLLALVCLMQMTVGLLIDYRYDETVFKIVPWIIWYPAAYWAISCVVTIIAFPKALFRPRNALAVWKSPDRGLR
jgi:poly-beta-1,6-N-acetyl-D-glucosamine synthase